MVWYAIAWIVLSVPMAHMGAYVGFSTDYDFLSKEFPYKAEIRKRAIPKQPWYFNSWTCPIAGAVIFGSVIFEFQYVLDSVWRSNIYLMFGILLGNLLILSIVCS